MTTMRRYRYAAIWTVLAAAVGILLVGAFGWWAGAIVAGLLLIGFVDQGF